MALTYRDIIKLQYPTKHPIQFVDNTYAGIVWNPLDFTPNPSQIELDAAIAAANETTVDINLGINDAAPSQALLIVNDFTMSGNLSLGGNIIHPGNTITFGGTGDIIVPSGNTAQRPTPTLGGIRFNTDTNEMEFVEDLGSGPNWSTHVQQDVIHDAQVFTGFVNSTDSTISFNNGTRTFTIAPFASQYEIYYQGIRIENKTSQSITIPNTEGIYYFYLDSAGTIQYQTTAWTLGQIQVAWAYWNVTQQIAYPFAEHRRGMNMPGKAYIFLNSALGLVVSNGLDLTNYTLAGAGTLDSDAQLSITDGTILDVDLTISIANSPTPSAPFQQILNGPAQLPIYHWQGSQLFYKETANAFALKQGTSRIQYNLNTAGTWSTVDVNEGYYTTTYMLGSTSISEPIFGVLDDQQYATLGDAQRGSNWNNYVNRNNIQSLVPFIRPMYALIFKSSASYANTPHAVLVETIDLQLIPPSGNLIDHSTLTGLNRDDHPQYVSESIARTITAQHTFAPTIVEAPFLLGSNAQNQLVVGLNADLLDGNDSSYFQTANVSLTALTNTALSTTGLYVVTSPSTSATRSITSTGSTINVTNGNGAGGNINVDLPAVITPTANTFDKITVDAYGRVTAITSAVAGDITSTLGYTPLNKAGDTMSGILDMGSNQINNLSMSNVATSTAAVNKGYVDSLSLGLIWQQPLELVNLISDAGGPPGSPVDKDAYLIGTGDNTGAWTGFLVGDVVQWQTSTWVFIKHAAINDRYGIDFIAATPAAGSFTAQENDIMTITGGTPGAWTYSFVEPVNNWALNVSNPNAVLYNNSFTYSITLSQWVAFSKSITISAGGGLYYAPSTTLNIGTASSSRIVVNPTNIDLATTTVTPGTFTKLTVDAYGRATLGANIASLDVTTALGYTPQTLNGNLTALSNTTTAGLYVVTGAGTSATRSISVPAGLSISNADGIAGNVTISLAGELAAVQGLATTGLTARTGTGTWATRSIVVPAGMTIANANGVLNNPTISLADNLASIEALVATGIVTSVTTSTFAARSFSGQSNQISITNGDLVAGSGTIALASNPIIPGTGSLTLPIGANTQQPVSPTAGMIRYDSTTSKMELYDTAWENVATEKYVVTTINSNVLISGDATGSGVTGSNTIVTLNTVNSNVGQFAVSTINSKGLVTAATNLIVTGDVSGTSSGPNLSLLLATVNGTVGQFGDAAHVPQITVNGKGLVTSVSNVAIPTTVAISGDVTSTGGTTSSNAVVTLNTVNSNVGAFGDSTHVATFTVNAKGLTTSAGNVAIPLAVTITGDATGSGTTSSNTAVTLATVNSNVGQFGDASHVSQVTVNGKGLITSISNVAIPNTVAISGDVTSTSGTTSSNAIVTLNTVNSNIGAFGDSTHVATFIVNAKGLTTAAGNVAIAWPTTETLSISTQTTTYTILSTDYTILGDATSASFVISLPAAPVNGMIFNIKKIDSTTNTVTVSGNGKNIDGASTAVIKNQWNSICVQYSSVAGAWFII